MNHSVPQWALDEMQKLRAEHKRYQAELQFIHTLADTTCRNSEPMKYIAAMLEVLTHTTMALNPPSQYVLPPSTQEKSK